MDPKRLNKNAEYVLQHVSGETKPVIYVYETINHFVFVSNREMIWLTPSNVNTQISMPHAKKME